MCTDRLATAPVDVNTNGLQQPRGLQPDDLVLAHSVLHALAPTWTLDVHHDTDGALMLMLTPPGLEDTTPTFVLTQAPYGIEIAAALGDSCDTLHTAPTIQRAVEAAVELHAQSTGLLREAATRA